MRHSRPTDLHSPGALGSVLLTPVHRIWESPAEVKLAGIALGGLQWIAGWPLLPKITLALAVFGAFDWLLGAERARRADRLDDNIARVGIITKLAGILVVYGVYIVEVLITEMRGGVGSEGPIASIFGLVLLLVEIDSFDRNLSLLKGGKPTPLLRPILNGFRAMLEKMLPFRPTDERDPAQRSADP